MGISRSKEVYNFKLSFDKSIEICSQYTLEVFIGTSLLLWTFQLIFFKENFVHLPHYLPFLLMELCKISWVSNLIFLTKMFSRKCNQIFSFRFL